QYTISIGIRTTLPAQGHELNEVYPRITLVTPSLNQGAFIGETIESVAAQEYPDLEYLVMDGGSVDGTHEIVARHAIVSGFVSEADRGQAHAINKGFAKATGELLGWLNADDLLEPGTLRRIADAYRREPFSLIYGDGWKLWQRTGLRRRIRVGTVDP